jgi:hypothetical protein
MDALTTTPDLPPMTIPGEKPGDRGPDGRIKPATFRFFPADFAALDRVVADDAARTGVKPSRNRVVRVLIHSADRTDKQPPAPAAVPEDPGRSRIITFRLTSADLAALDRFVAAEEAATGVPSNRNRVIRQLIHSADRARKKPRK